MAISKAESSGTYHETQVGPWSAICSAIGATLLAGAWMLNWQPVAIGLYTGGPALLFLAACFHHLTIADCGDRLAIHFGPLPLFRTFIKYDAVRAIEIRRTQLIEGWGLHLSIRGGWLWNIWGRTCVSIRHSQGTTCIGTADPERLSALLREKAPHLSQSCT